MTRRQLTVAPRFTISISPIVMEADYRGSCDLVGSADPTLVWVDPAGTQHREDPSGGVVNGFAGSWRDVAIGSDHRLPTLSWIDRDPGEAGENVQPRGSAPLLPLPEDIGEPDFAVGVPAYVVPVAEELRDAGGDDCTARMTYRISYVLQSG